MLYFTSKDTSASSCLNRRMLQKKPDATVLVMSPTIPLATQNAGVFVKGGFEEEGFKVNVFSSQHPIPKGHWHMYVREYSVMAMTPAILLNQLEEGIADPKDIDMLVRIWDTMPSA